MNDPTITSYPLQSDLIVYDNEMVQNDNPIGQKCHCTCHCFPGYWGDNEPEVCCGTLHQKQTEVENDD